MSRYHHVLGLAALATSLVLATDASSALQLQRTAGAGIGTQLAIGAAPAEAWKAGTVGMEFDIGVSAARITAVSKATSGRTTFTKALPGAAASSFDTDLGSNVLKIAFDPVVLQLVELPGTAAVAPTWRPGAIKPGAVSFTMKPAKGITDWVRGFASTSPPSPRDVTINMKSQAGVVLRTVALKGCFPESYATDGKLSYLTLRPAGIVVGGVANKVFAEWAQQALNGSAQRRDLRLTYTEGSVSLATVTLKNALLTELTWSVLDAQTAGPLDESFTVQPEQVDGLP